MMPHALVSCLLKRFTGEAGRRGRMGREEAGRRGNRQYEALVGTATRIAPLVWLYACAWAI
jgi:hypothetical protein